MNCNLKEILAQMQDSVSEWNKDCRTSEPVLRHCTATDYRVCMLVYESKSGIAPCAWVAYTIKTGKCRVMTCASTSKPYCVPNGGSLLYRQRCSEVLDKPSTCEGAIKDKKMIKSIGRELLNLVIQGIDNDEYNEDLLDTYYAVLKNNTSPAEWADLNVLAYSC